MSKKSYELGSGNVFQDLGIPNAEEHLVKAQLVFKIDTIMKGRGLKQAEAARLLGVKQPVVSKMLRGDFKQFFRGTAAAFSSCHSIMMLKSW